MDQLLRDLRLSLKLLRKEKTFSATVLVTLALCLAANVAIFSVVHTVLLEPLPFQDADRLVHVFNSYPRAGAPRASSGTVDFIQRRERVDAFQEVAIYQGSGHTVGEPGATERVTTTRVSPSLFPLLGVEAAVGRTFTEDEMEPGRHQAVVLTHGYWEEYFGGAGDVVGRELRVDGEPFTVVGVLPESFALPDRPETRFFLPIPIGEAERDPARWHSNSFQMLARLRPGATVGQARAQNAALNNALIEEWPIPNARQLLDDAGFETRVVPAQADMVRDVRPVLYLLWAGVGLVLLIGCVNIANLMLARARTRANEVATRLALGASRARVARQVLTEAVVLGVLGGALGVGLGVLGLELLLGLGAGELPRGAEISVDGPVLLFTLALSLGAGLLFGAIPMVQLMRGDLSPVFRTEGRTGTASRGAVLLRNGLVTTQVALAFVLLIGAGLMLMSFRAALSVDPGFDPKGVFTAFVSLPEARYPAADDRRRFLDELERAVATVPGVEAAGLATNLPFTGSVSSSIIFPEGYVPTPGESILSPFQTVAGPGYFRAMGIEVLQGRGFLASDGPDDPRVIVIDEWLAQRFWPDGNAVGERLVWGEAPGTDAIPEESYFTVVGVVETVKQTELTSDDAEHVGAYYFTHRQQPRSFVTIAARAAGGDAEALAPDIRRVVERLDPELPLFGIQSMQGRVEASLTGRRLPLLLLGVFAGVALFLAVVGIYGALAYAVSQRRREIGIRMAMGSDPGRVFRQVVLQGLKVTGAGLAAGAVAALLAVRLLESLLFGVRPADPVLMLGVALVLAAVGLAACMVPARRATRVDPVEALAGS